MADRLVEHFGDMARNNAWANARLLGACEALSEAALAAPRTGFFPSLKETLNHVLVVDLYYLDALEEGGVGSAIFASWTPIGAPAALRAAQGASDRRLIAFCDRLEERDLARRVATERGPKGRPTERIDALLAHLFQHQIHHRGQAHAMLSGTETAPPQLDDFFLDFERDPSVAEMGLTPRSA